VAEPGVFEAFYASDWQQPIALWLAAAIGAAIGLARRDLHPSVRAYCLALAALSGLDAWLTATNVFGIGALPGRLALFVPLGFVLAGDFRYFLFLESAQRDGRIAFAPLGVARAVGLTLIVPIVARVVSTWAAPDNARVLFFVYESSFCALTLALLRHPNAREHAWVRAVSGFVLLYYGLWAAADALLLATGADVGYAVRMIPNLLYYGGLFAAIALLAPRQP
jgi:hypothetical protein